MAQDLDLEVKVVSRFVVKAKRDRYLSFVTSPRNRGKLLADLHSATVFLKMEAFEQVIGLEEETIKQTLQRHGLSTSTCYVISDNKSLDTQRLPLPEALCAVVGWGLGTLLVFGDAQVVYFEGEGKNIRYISR
ncbi:MAG: hypothetical protein ACRYFZ_20980 [Janthinobacterium lividum]